MRLLRITFFLLFVSFSGLQAQKLDHRLGYVLLQIEKGIALKDILSSNSSRIQGTLIPDRIISERLGIYLVRFDYSRINERSLLSQFRADRNVLVAQFDHLLTQRDIPDDPKFNNQWQWFNTGQTGGTADADIDADIAWDTSHGGVTAAGDTIVVAIIDDGLDYNHEDIAANAWINHHEIDGNGIDDDENGYIDDIHGWNAYDNNPDVWGQDHGLNVAGMIGAVGNNQIGVTGVNWNVKLMIIVGGSPESSAIASYAYALEERILYNESNGEKGAFVVATNSSWGEDFGQPADAPLWCAFYDTLGVHGILSAAATANLNIDVDAVGDLPTACPSEYLLSVTALNASNQRTFSAYGLTNIDFGAPGEDIYTTRRNNGYGTTSGTSFASPVAAGLVALLYSAPLPGFAQLSHTNPSAAAQFIRDLIFEGVDPIAGLDGTIRFGGGLNAGNSMNLMMAKFGECPVPFAITDQILSSEEVEISWSIIDTADATNARFKPLSAATWDTLFDVSQPLLLSGLTACTEYEIEFESICSDTSTGFQSNHHFITDGCCQLPGGIIITTGPSYVNLSWDEVLAADFFIVQWRPEGTEEWIEEATPETNIAITDLEGCTFYEIRLQTSCDTTETGFSEIMRVRTKGCGNCIDLEYCEGGSDDASQENIDSLIIGPLTNHSGQNNGYFFFEDLGPEYRAGEQYDVWIRPGFSTGEKFDEQFRIWVDANQDGEFGDDELLLDSVLLNNDTFLISQLTIPADALAGSTRMRVSMAFANLFPTDQPPCGKVDFGEVEDYCITILRNPDPCPPVDTVFFDGISFTGAYMYWPSTEGAIAYTYRWREVGTTDYDELATIDTTANLVDLEKCKTYEVQIRTICVWDTTGYNKIYLLKTDCDVAVTEINPLLASFKLYPNPTTDFVTLKLQALESGDHNVTLYNMQGQRVQHEVVFAAKNEVTEVRFDNLESYPPGLYFAVVEKNGKSMTKKFIKM